MTPSLTIPVALVARTATANIVNIVCPKEEGIIASKLQQRTNQEARFVIFIPGVFQSKGPPGPARGTPWPYPRGAPGRPVDMKMWSPCCEPTRIWYVIYSHENTALGPIIDVAIILFFVRQVVLSCVHGPVGQARPRGSVFRGFHR